MLTWHRLESSERLAKRDSVAGIYVRDCLDCGWQYSLGKWSWLYTKQWKGLQKWSSTEEHWLLFQRTWVRSQAPTWQLILSLSPVPGEAMASPGFYQHCTHRQHARIEKIEYIKSEVGISICVSQQAAFSMVFASSSCFSSWPGFP